MGPALDPVVYSESERQVALHGLYQHMLRGSQRIEETIPTLQGVSNGAAAWHTARGVIGDLDNISRAHRPGTVSVRAGWLNFAWCLPGIVYSRPKSYKIGSLPSQRCASSTSTWSGAIPCALQTQSCWISCRACVASSKITRASRVRSFLSALLFFTDAWVSAWELWKCDDFPSKLGYGGRICRHERIRA